MRRAAIRVAVQSAGLLVGYVFLNLDQAELFETAAPWLSGAATFAVAAYYLWILVDILRKRDPIYDRVAGTAVVRAGGR